MPLLESFTQYKYYSHVLCFFLDLDVKKTLAKMHNSCHGCLLIDNNNNNNNNNKLVAKAN
jgi:hypothetical protein